MDQQVENQTTWRKQYKATETEADYAYKFVQLFDALSLILCMNQIPLAERHLEVSTGPDGIPHYILQRKDDTLTIEPWPFDEPVFSVHVETFQLTQLVFKNDRELYKAIQQAPIVMNEWTFKK